MSLTVGRTTFDRVVYDAEADVMYLHVGEPSDAVDFDESPEGHALRFDDQGRLIGVTLVNVRRSIEEGGRIVVTVPERFEVDPDALADAVAAA